MFLNPVARILQSYFSGDKEAITAWLRTPNIGFGGKSPNDMMADGHFYKVWQYCLINLKGKKYGPPDLTKKN